MRRRGRIFPFMKRMGYHLKVMWGGYWIGACAVLVFSAVLAANADSLGFPMPERELQKAVLTVTMTVFAALVFSAAAAEELEERVMRLLYTYSFPAAVVILEKIAICLILLMAGISLCAAAAVAPLPATAETGAGLPAAPGESALSQDSAASDGIVGIRVDPWDDWWALMRAAAPASLFIGAVSATASLIGRNVLVGLGAGIGYWIMELLSHGKWTGPLYLFQSVWPNKGIDDDNNALLLVCGAAVLVCLAAVTVVKGKPWLAKT